MAFHEQHERACPTCGQRISATAPKCFNCGEPVDDDEADDEEETSPRIPWAGAVVVLVVAAALVGGAIVYLVRG